MKKIKFLFVVFLIVKIVQAQPKDIYFENFELKIDTSVFTLAKNTHLYQLEKYLFFKSTQNQGVAEIIFRPNSESLIEKIEIISTTDYVLIDSVRAFEGNVFSGKIKFSDLENGKNIGLILSLKLTNGKNINYQIKLYSYQETYISQVEENIDVFVDEEKTIEIPCSDPYNIRYNSDFSDSKEDDISISPSLNTLKIKLKSKSIGNKKFTIRLKTIKPFINQNNEISYDLPSFKIGFQAKPNRIDYLNPVEGFVFFNPDFKASSEIQFEYNKNLLLRKTYRIEDQAENGGNLIAEIFTQSQIGNNNKILCRIRTFSVHSINDSYLYIKDGDKTRFMSNFNITEKPRLDEMNIMHEGEDWTNNLAVSPGETIEVRLKGKGLQSSHFKFDGAEKIILDSSRLTDEVAFFTMKIPQNIPKKKINVFMNKEGSAYSLMIKEFQKTTNFDFVMVNYGDKTLPLTHAIFDKPIFYDKSIKDINLNFDLSKIDENGKIHGKQYLNIEVKLLNSRNDLIEIQNINHVVVCPNETSPRGSFYDFKDCNNQTISLNDVLVHKTYSLEPFTQVYITITHDAQKYGNATGFARKIKLILKRKVSFDLQVSFPAGLLLKKFNEPGYGNLSGISIAFIAQMSFYDGERVNKFKPYNFGAGFIALDAFNYSENSKSRDLGIVVLATLIPIQSAKLSFPLYLGGGYLLRNATPFILFGPGLRFNF
ncbi:MAG: hypothetical protein EAZ27_02925 [Cytophagales bacterium]|nr:MAG: hypothetical protein EAZ27_02925 [Cytophagales bacterium]